MQVAASAKRSTFSAIAPSAVLSLRLAPAYPARRRGHRSGCRVNVGIPHFGQFGSACGSTNRAQRLKLQPKTFGIPCLNSAAHGAQRIGASSGGTLGKRGKGLLLRGAASFAHGVLLFLPRSRGLGGRGMLHATLSICQVLSLKKKKRGGSIRAHPPLGLPRASQGLPGLPRGSQGPPRVCQGAPPPKAKAPLGGT